jgi:hypothetical protein
VNAPFFPAVTPIIHDDQSSNSPTIPASESSGYIPYYADRGDCDPDANGNCTYPVKFACSVTAKEVADIRAWGATYNTLQWIDSAVDCAPA